jgi:hypothetical protein
MARRRCFWPHLLEGGTMGTQSVTGGLGLPGAPPTIRLGKSDSAEIVPTSPASSVADTL